MKSRTKIHPEETAQDLHDRLSMMGADLIVETIHKISKQGITPQPQDHDQASYVTMLTKADGEIDWTRSDRAVCAHINAMTPWPGAFTQLSGKRLKIFKAVPGPVPPPDSEPGQILSCSDQGIWVAAGKNSVLVIELMGSSGKRLTADAFLRGNKIDLPARFE